MKGVVIILVQMGKYTDWYCGIFTEAYLEDKLSPTEKARPSHDLIEREGLPNSNTILLQQQKFPRSNTIVAAPERWFQDEVSSEEPQEISRGHGKLSPSFLQGNVRRYELSAYPTPIAVAYVYLSHR